MPGLELALLLVPVSKNEQRWLRWLSLRYSHEAVGLSSRLLASDRPSPGCCSLAILEVNGQMRILSLLIHKQFLKTRVLELASLGKGGQDSNCWLQFLARLHGSLRRSPSQLRRPKSKNLRSDFKLLSKAVLRDLRFKTQKSSPGSYLH